MVWQLQQVHPNRPDAVAFQTALTNIVNLAAESPEAADAAYFELEDMHSKVTAVILQRLAWPYTSQNFPGVFRWPRVQLYTTLRSSDSQGDTCARS